MRDIGSILSKITGSTIDTISIAVLIARICNNKIILLSSGDSAKSDYLIRPYLLQPGPTDSSFNFSNIDLLEEIRRIGYDISSIPKYRNVIKDVIIQHLQ